MIDDGMGFQRLPWQPALELQLGKHVSGVMSPGGAVDWHVGRNHSLGPCMAGPGPLSQQTDLKISSSHPLLRRTIQR